MGRGTAQLKRQYYVLHTKVRLNPKKTCKVIYVYVLLHNICKARSIPVSDEDVEDAMPEGGEANQVQLNPVIPAARNGITMPTFISSKFLRFHSLFIKAAAV